jgi:hypothetical protein
VEKTGIRGWASLGNPARTGKSVETWPPGFP